MPLRIRNSYLHYSSQGSRNDHVRNKFKKKKKKKKQMLSGDQNVFVYKAKISTGTKDPLVMFVVVVFSGRPLLTLSILPWIKKSIDDILK